MANWLTIFFTSIVWWCCCFGGNTPATCLLINETDRSALIAFKAAIDQDPFGALRSWNDSSVHYCHWNGISCSRRHLDRVVELNLMSQGLIGSLSPHIGNLSFLKTIVLQNNSFHGPIPQEMGHLFRLQNIDFSNNSFHGEIPTNLSRCSNLEILNLIDNKLTGNIPTELGSLSKLKGLGLSINKLSGTIPPSLGNLSFLYKLSLGDCGLNGEIPKEIGQLQSLKMLQISQNNLFGEIPAGIYNISTLSIFHMFSNQLRGSIPPDIGLSLPNLQHLVLGLNRFTGRLPISLSNASRLQQIVFSHNEFAGPIPRDLGKLSSLRLLNLANNRLQDDLPSFISSLTNCTSLEDIVIGHNLLRGPLPESIANLSSTISVIGMENNSIHGSIPSGIENLLSLTMLVMEFNHLSGPIPSTIGKLHYLQQIFLGANNFTELPSLVGNLTLLNLLDLMQNNIYGSIPPSLGNCHSLLALDLSHNNLHGSIPPEIMSLSSISISLSLAYNALIGSLPSEVGFLKNLAVLDVSNNRLSGPVPNSLSNCLSLERLHLEGNSFEGEIPQSLRELRGLRELDLSRNNLSGLIPSYLGELHLEKLNLSFNELHGEVPMEGVFRNESAISVVGNIDLCGGISHLGLPLCPSSKSNKNKLSHKMKVIIFVVVVLVLCSILLVCIFVFIYWRLVSRKKASSMPSLKHHVLRVSYAELLKATDGFSRDNLIGVGNYGSVYKGILNQVQTVAVKVLNLQLKGASKSFISECKALRTVRHRNLLKILSACSSMDFEGNDFKALVYEFMANGSLEKWLHQDGVQNDLQEEQSSNLKLIRRLNIAIDVASAIEYLHCHCDSTISHGDLKPSNVLLDDEMIAHVGDFGLAKIISTISSEVVQHQSNSIAVRGTIGYIAPEYALDNRASTLADVYSYGILLLEMFTGKRPTNNAFKDDLSLHSFVKSALPDQVLEVVDPRILLEHEPRSWLKDNLVSILRIGVACSMESPRDRMQIQDVVSELCKIKNVCENNGLRQD